VTPRIVAHRTLERDRPENSLAGIRLAGEVGADVVEVDVRRTSDGVPMLLHDGNLARTTGVPLPISWLPSSVVRRIPLLRGHGERIPTLEAALTALPDGVRMAIDTKDSGAAPAVLQVVERLGMLDRVLPWSMHGKAVQHFAQHAPNAEVALLRDATRPGEVDKLFADANAWGAQAVSVHETVGTREFVEQAAARGILVYCWYQSLAAQQQHLHTYLHGIVTDWPVEAREALGLT
jgi:glycerophosphoryl diester phosphodiesterase